MTRVYVAGSSGELERVERVMTALRERDCVITHDWTPSVRDAIARGLSDAQLDDHEARRIAMRDLNGVGSADVVLFLAPEKPTRGAWVELGYAVACARTEGSVVYVSGPGARQSIFTRCAEALFLSDDDAVSAIARPIELRRWGGVS